VQFEPVVIILLTLVILCGSVYLVMRVIPVFWEGDDDVEIRKGKSRLAQEHFILAERHFTKALEINPEAVEALYLRGLVHGKKNRLEAAYQDFSEVIKLDPEDANGYFGRAFASYNIKNYDAALQDADKAVSLDATVALYHHVRGNIHEVKEQPEAAIADYRAYLALVPDHHGMLLRLGQLYLMTNNVEGAITIWHQVKDIELEDGLDFNNRGYLSTLLSTITSDHYDLAHDDLEVAAEILPQEYYVHGSQGTLNLLVNNLDAALANFQQSLELKPDHHFALMGIALVQYARGNLDEAKKQWQALLEKEPRYADSEWIRTKWGWTEPLLERTRQVHRLTTE
jgi:tetratricopeptide (TPR) repeat protein